MKNLEKIIHDNRSVFDSFEPGEGHFERFEQKLNQQQSRPARTFTLGFMLKAAVITLLVVLSGLWIYDNTFAPPVAKNGIALREISPEYSEVEMYYTKLVNQKYHEINEFSFIDSTQKEMLVHELNEMDSIYENLKKDLRVNPNDDRVINAMIQHYQLKVEVMNQILNQLQHVKTIEQQKTDNHESTTI
ncbi:MAG: hypothetical protein V2I54_00285 [Bacteroidales bacterium]|jgi:hypothetical protein|nr:hypothetical protein [Bacteroidales bacterium]